MFQVRAFRPAPLASAAVTNFTQLQTLILSSSTTTTTTRFSCFPALECAIERYQMLFGDGAFYNRLLPLIVDWAAVTAPAGCTTTSAAGDVLLELDPLVFDSESPPPPPPPDSDSSPLLFREKSVSLSCDQARFILANCFLGNNPHTPATTGHLDYSALDLLRLFSCKATEDSIAAERILCLLSYFHSSTTSAAAARSITFTRRQLTSSSSSSTTTSTSINAFYSNLPLLTQISLFPGSMEDSSSESFVDFANQRIHIFSIIDSATQEEVLFSCCPEAYIAMGLFPTMQDNEAILISGVVRTATYSGYAHTFQFKGLYPDEGPRRIENIIAIDASRKNHFTKESVLRDIFKAALGFSSSSSHSSSSSIVTGHWGCGIFGGQKTHKFLQQWVAASIATNVSRLDYSVFGDVKLIEFWQRIIQAIQQKKWTVCDVCKNLLQLADDDDYDEDKDITLSSTKHRHSNYDQFVAKLLAL